MISSPAAPTLARHGRGTRSSSAPPHARDAASAPTRSLSPPSTKGRILSASSTSSPPTPQLLELSPTSSSTVRGSCSSSSLPDFSPSPTFSPPAPASSRTLPPPVVPLPPTIRLSTPTSSTTGSAAASTSSAAPPPSAAVSRDGSLPSSRAPPLMPFNPPGPVPRQEMSRSTIELSSNFLAGPSTNVVTDRQRADVTLDMVELQNLADESNNTESGHEWRMENGLNNLAREWDTAQGTENGTGRLLGDAGQLRQRKRERDSSSSSSSSSRRGSNSGGSSSSSSSSRRRRRRRGSNMNSDGSIGRGSNGINNGHPESNESKEKARKRWARLGILALLLLAFHGSLVLITWKLLKHITDEKKLDAYVALCWFGLFMVLQGGKYLVDTAYDFEPTRKTELIHLCLHAFTLVMFLMLGHAKIGENQIYSKVVAHAVAYFLEIMGAAAIQLYCKASVDIDASGL